MRRVSFASECWPRASQFCFCFFILVVLPILRQEVRYPFCLWIGDSLRLMTENAKTFVTSSNKKKVGTIYGHQASCNSCRRQFGFSRLASSTVEAVTPIGIELIMLSTCCEWFGACGLVSSPARPGPAQCAVCGCPSNVKRNTSLVASVLPPPGPTSQRIYILENGKSETPVVHAAAAGGGQAGTCTFRTSLDCSRHLHPIVTHYGNGSKYKWYGHVYNMMKLASHGLTLDLQAFRII